MTFISSSVDAFLLTSAAVAIPTFYYIRNRNSMSDTPYRDYLTILLLAHTLYILYALFLCWPPNIFQRLRIPLNAPTEFIRSTILRHSKLDANATLPKGLETLLTRLSSFEMRTLYVRFGQIVVQECEHCKTFDDYALFALPRALLEYVREAAILGLLTITGSGRERWRTYIVGALVCVAILEAYWISTAKVHVPQDGMRVFMWHDSLWAIRHMLFLLLPILTHFLPSSRPRADPATPALVARATLEQTMTRLATLRYTRGAVMRDPTLRGAAEEWWDRQRVEGEWARTDEGVQRVAERLGRGFTEGGVDGREGKLKTAAREGVAKLKSALTTMPQS